MRVLAGDIGGTKTLLQLAEVVGQRCRVYHEQRFVSNDWSDLLTMVVAFLQSFSQDLLPESACFGVAGPVQENQVTVTNLSWPSLVAGELAQSLKIKRVAFINDFQAVGYGLAALVPEDVAILQVGQERPGQPRALLGAGTGLGQGILVWREQEGYYPLATEGGHVDFAPVDGEQQALLTFLQARYSHVSYERILSGPGLVALYQFIASQHGQWIGDKDPATITTAALTGTDPWALAALALFVRIYGQQAGNLALTCLAQGGVYLAGGIAPRILPVLRDGSFMRAFLAKGRFAPLLATVPVRVVLNSRVGLLGAALVAAQ